MLLCCSGWLHPSSSLIYKSRSNSYLGFLLRFSGWTNSINIDCSAVKTLCSAVFVPMGMFCDPRSVLVTFTPGFVSVLVENEKRNVHQLISHVCPTVLERLSCCIMRIGQLRLWTFVRLVGGIATFSVLRTCCSFALISLFSSALSSEDVK